MKFLITTTETRLGFCFKTNTMSTPKYIIDLFESLERFNKAIEEVIEYEKMLYEDSKKLPRKAKKKIRKSCKIIVSVLRKSKKNGK